MSIPAPHAASATPVGAACDAPVSSGAPPTPARDPAPTTAPGPAGARGAGARILSRVRAAARSLRWFVRELMGDSAYDKYVERHRLDHPDHEPMTPAQWWRAKADAEASAPQTRCC